jgi:GNAT superfamily N-acetyltransferase
MEETKLITADQYRDHFFEIKEFCKQAAEDNEFDMAKKQKNLCQTTLNITPRSWAWNSHSLLHKIYIAEDFADGALTLHYVDRKLACIAGIERSKHDESIAIAGKRTYMLSGYRGHRRFSMMLEEQIDWATKNGIKCVLLTVNEYNTSVYNVLKRISNNRGHLGTNNPTILKRFIEYPSKLYIQGCWQHVFHYGRFNNKYESKE